jgi:hypothetical protein
MYMCMCGRGMCGCNSNVDRLVDLAIFAASEDMRQTRIKDADVAFVQAHTLACKMLTPVHRESCYTGHLLPSRSYGVY